MSIRTMKRTPLRCRLGWHNRRSVADYVHTGCDRDPREYGWTDRACSRCQPPTAVARPCGCVLRPIRIDQLIMSALHDRTDDSVLESRVPQLDPWAGVGVLAPHSHTEAEPCDDRCSVYDRTTSEEGPED